MGHIDYSSAFSGVTAQRNVMAFVGNGFDIQALHDYRSRVDTRYENFYAFLERRHFDPSNPILKKMGSLRAAGKKDWSDVEGAVDKLLRGPGRIQTPTLIEALRQMQGQFSEFLDRVVTSALLTDLGQDSATHKRAIESMSAFLYDLPPAAFRESGFPRNTANLDLYNFVFVNFNYTPLLDDFIYLDQVQFDPLPHKTVDRNFYFKSNPRGVDRASVRPFDSSSSYLMTEVIHPHGQQSIPRSLLFGIDEPGRSAGNQDPRLRLAKPFWAQNKHRYSHLFDDTELFIIFGCSLGEVDRWWWRHIAEALGKERTYSNGSSTYRPELIIYWYNDGPTPLTDNQVRERFLEAADCDVANADTLIHIVPYDSLTERVWLRTDPKTPVVVRVP